VLLFRWTVDLRHRAASVRWTETRSSRAEAHLRQAGSTITMDRPSRREEFNDFSLFDI